jgi:hydrogenase small subunit
MYIPHPEPWLADETLGEHLERRGIDRRDFVKFCGQMTVMLGLGQSMIPKVAEALQQVKRPSVIWASLMECTGCTESVLRSADPSIGDLVLDLVSLDFQENLQAAAGHEAEAALQAAMKENYGKYLLIVTGSASSPRTDLRPSAAAPPTRCCGDGGSAPPR